MKNYRNYKPPIKTGIKSLTQDFHTGNVQYYEDYNWKDINTKLVSSGLNNWEMIKAPYKVQIPKRSDGEIIFLNKDQEINFTPIGEVKEGILINENTVKYPDVFGKGIDLEIIIGKNNFRKEVVINKKPDNLKSDLILDFELNLSNIDVIKEETNLSGNVDISKGSLLDKEFNDSIELESSDTKSYIRKAYVWDNFSNREEIKIQFISSDSKQILRKVIPKEFLERAVYPVRTDATISYNIGTGNGTSQVFSSVPWSVGRNALAGNFLSTNLLSIGAGFSVATSLISRTFLPIDTSGLNDNAIILNAILSIKVVSAWSGIPNIFIVQTSQASTSEIINSDYIQCGDVHNPIMGSNLTMIEDTIVYSIQLNAIGLSWINKNGWTKLGIRDNIDRDGQETPVVVNNYGIDGADGGAVPPILAISYALPYSLVSYKNGGDIDLETGDYYKLISGDTDVG